MDRSFTVTSAGGLLSTLALPLHVSGPNGTRTEFHAMFDTGATKSVITRRVVEACGLRPLRSIKPILMQGVEGLARSEAYEVSIHLPDKMTIRDLTVFSKNPGDVWWDVLIGMDVISIGDFSVRNVDSKTEWSFSIPSRHYEGAS